MTDTQPDTGTHWVEYIQLDQIQTAARNAKRHDKAGIARSLDRFGLAELPTLDERTGRLVAGHGRTEDLVARQARGENPPRGVKVEGRDWLVPVLRGWASHDDQEADAYAVTSNQLTINGGWDQAELSRIVTDLATSDMELARVTGLGADLDAILRAGDFHGRHAVNFLVEDMNTSPAAPVGVLPSQSPPVAGEAPLLNDAATWPEGWTEVGTTEGGGVVYAHPLDGVDASGPSDMAEHAAATGASTLSPVEGEPWVQLAWSATVSQREVVRAAIREAQQRTGVATSVEALVAVCQAYTDGAQ